MATTTPFKLPTSVIANGQGVNGWITPDNILLVDDEYAVSGGSTNVIEVGNFNLSIPQGSDLTNFTVQVKGYRGSFNTTLQVYAVDTTTGSEISYPLAPFQGFSGSNTLYSLPSSLFGTTWTVDQANNIKLRLIADGELWLDAVLINADYVPQVTPVTPPSSTGLAVVDEFVEALPFNLAQSMTDQDIYMFLESFDYPDGTEIQYADFHGEADMVIDQGVPGKEESVMITNVEHNYQGTGLVRISFTTLNNRGLKFKYPYDHDVNLVVSHDGSAQCVISNSARFYSRFLRRNQIGVLVSAPIYVSNQGTLLVDPMTELAVIGAGASIVNDGTDSGKKVLNIPGNGVNPANVITTSSATSGASQVPTLTWSHVSSGTDRLLTVQVETEAATTISGITYNGVALTQGVFVTNGTLRNEQWYLIAPAVGTYSIVVSVSPSAYVTAGAETWNTADQSSPIGATQTATGTSLSPSLVLTTGTDNSIVIDSLATGTLPIVYTAGAGQSENWHITANPNARQGASSAERAGTAVDNVTMSWAITQSIPWAMTAMEITGIPSPLPGVTQIVAGTNVTISPTGGTGIVTVNATPSSGGIISINGDTTAAQTIVPGTGIAVSTVAGVTTVTNTGSSGSSGLVKAQTGGASVAIAGGTVGTSNLCEYTAYLSRSGGSNLNSDVLVEYGGQTIANLTGIGAGGTSSGSITITGQFFGTGTTGSQNGNATLVTTYVSGGVTITQSYSVSNSLTVDSTMSQNLTFTVTNNVAGTLSVQSIVVKKFS